MTDFVLLEEHVVRETAYQINEAVTMSHDLLVVKLNQNPTRVYLVLTAKHVALALFLYPNAPITFFFVSVLNTHFNVIHYDPTQY